MNSELELTDDAATESPVTFPAFPPLPDDPDPNSAELLVTIYEKTLAGLPTISKHTLEAYGDAVEQIKNAEKGMEAKRKAKVAPLNKDVKEINEAYTPFVERFNAMWKRLAAIPNQFIEEERRRVEDEQRRLNAETERLRLAEEDKAKKDREAAAAAAAAGNVKEAAKLENSADRHEMKAAAAVPTVVQQVSKKVETATGTTAFSGGKKVWTLVGWDKESQLPCTDPLLALLVGELATLPPGVRFLLEHSYVSKVLLNKSYSPTKPLPKPFSEMTDYSGATNRGKGK